MKMSACMCPGRNVLKDVVPDPKRVMRRAMAFPWMVPVLLVACVGLAQEPEWIVRFSFEDAGSCSLPRRVEIYDSGLVTYLAPHKGAPSKFGIGASGASELIELVRSFPKVDGGYMEEFGDMYRTDQSRQVGPKIIHMVNRGDERDLSKLIQEVAQRAGILWEQVVPLQGANCGAEGKKYPFGSIVLREDIE